MLHVRLADLHRRAELRHLMSATIHERLADQGHEPLIRELARLAGTSSVLAMLGSQAGAAAMVAVSDGTAHAAHDLELVLAEGPETDAFGGTGPVLVAGPALVSRWPMYGPAVAELGVQAVSAAPLGSGRATFGAVCAFGCATACQPAEPQRMATATTLMADVLTGILLTESDNFPAGDGLGILEIFSDSDLQLPIHQAVGAISAQGGYSIADAGALLAARAFADGRPVSEVARQVLLGETRL